MRLEEVPIAVLMRPDCSNAGHRRCYRVLKCVNMNPKSDSEISESVRVFNRLQEFVRDAMPGHWLEYAEELHDSAELVWRHEDESLRLRVHANAGRAVVGEPLRVSGVSRTYLLLAGFALENVLKGLLVESDPSYINKGNLSRELKSHNILALASKVRDLPLSCEEKEFCDVVTAAIPYWGRYPIPLTKNDVVPEVAITEALRRIFLNLFERLAHRLYWAVRDGWDSRVGPEQVKSRSLRYGDRIDPNEIL